MFTIHLDSVEVSVGLRFSAWFEICYISSLVTSGIRSLIGWQNRIKDGRGFCPIILSLCQVTQHFTMIEKNFGKCLHHSVYCWKIFARIRTVGAIAYLVAYKYNIQFFNDSQRFEQFKYWRGLTSVGNHRIPICI